MSWWEMTVKDVSLQVKQGGGGDGRGVRRERGTADTRHTTYLAIDRRSMWPGESRLVDDRSRGRAKGRRRRRGSAPSRVPSRVSPHKAHPVSHQHKQRSVILTLVILALPCTPCKARFTGQKQHQHCTHTHAHRKIHCCTVLVDLSLLICPCFSDGAVSSTD